MTKKQIKQIKSHLKQFFGNHKAYEITAVQGTRIKYGYQVGFDIMDYNKETIYIEIDIVIPYMKIVAIFLRLNGQYIDIMAINNSAYKEK